MIISMFAAVYSAGMLRVGEPEGREGGLADLRLWESNGGGGRRGHIWHSSGAIPVCLRWILPPKDLAKQSDRP